MNILKELKEYYNESPGEFVGMFVYTTTTIIVTVMCIILVNL
jgi:hypothetical protein